MTEHFRRFMISELGTGSGTKRYRDMVHLLNASGYPKEPILYNNNKPVMGVSAETIQAMQGFDDNRWNEAYRTYQGTPGYSTLRLSTTGLAEIRRLIADYDPNS